MSASADSGESTADVLPGRVVVLGSGNAFNQDGRCSSAMWIHSAGGGILMDVGPTTLLAAARYGVDLGALRAIFVTHLHGDHTAGWPFLTLHLALRERRQAPLDVYGPLGTRRVLEGLSELCFGGQAPGCDFDVRFHELPVVRADGVDGPDGVQVDVTPMHHHPSSIGYRLGLGPWRLAFSGDTGWCAGLEDLAAGSDALFVECTSVAPEHAQHLSLADLRRSRDRLAARILILVHVNDAIAVDLARDPLPGVVVAYDGWTFNPRSPASEAGLRRD